MGANARKKQAAIAIHCLPTQTVELELLISEHPWQFDCLVAEKVSS